MSADLFPQRQPAHDPGGSRRFPLKPGVRGSAEFSPCGCYRYWLRRDWGPVDAPYLLSVGANPSTADARVDDPTLRLDQAMTIREGFTSLVKVNVCDYRATNPRQLVSNEIVPCSARNFEWITRLAAGAAKIVLCWGHMHPTLEAYQKRAVAAMPSGAQLWCIGRTAHGSPRHPLYSPVGPLIEWRW